MRKASTRKVLYYEKNKYKKNIALWEKQVNIVRKTGKNLYYDKNIYKKHCFVRKYKEWLYQSKIKLRIFFWSPLDFYNSLAVYTSFVQFYWNSIGTEGYWHGANVFRDDQVICDCCIKGSFLHVAVPESKENHFGTFIKSKIPARKVRYSLFFHCSKAFVTLFQIFNQKKYLLSFHRIVVGSVVQLFWVCNE